MRKYVTALPTLFLTNSCSMEIFSHSLETSFKYVIFIFFLKLHCFSVALQLQAVIVIQLLVGVFREALTSESNLFN